MIFLFSLSAIALIVAATAIILPALRNRRPINRDDRARQNIRIAQQRLGELAPRLEQTNEHDPDDHATLRQTCGEIEAALLDDLPQDETDPTKPPKQIRRACTGLIVIMIPFLSIGIYLLLGMPTALMPAALTAAVPPLAQKTPPMEELVEQLEQKLDANPGNAEGWELAGKTYMSLGRFRQAEQAYQTLHQLVGDDAHVLTAWADAALMANNGAFSPQIQARIERALEIRPEYDNALWMAALAAESRGDHPQALEYLERLLPLMEGRPGEADVTQFIERIRE